MSGKSKDWMNYLIIIGLRDLTPTGEFVNSFQQGTLLTGEFVNFSFGYLSLMSKIVGR